MLASVRPEPPYSANDAERRRVSLAQRISNRDYQLPNLEPPCISNLGWCCTARRQRALELEDGQIPALRPSPHVRRQALTTDHHLRSVTTHDVVISDDKPIVAPHHA
jgi:hypothetical protein